MGTFPAACREGCLCLSLLVPHRLRRETHCSYLSTILLMSCRQSLIFTTKKQIFMPTTTRIMSTKTDFPKHGYPLIQLMSCCLLFGSPNSSFLACSSFLPVYNDETIHSSTGVLPCLPCLGVSWSALNKRNLSLMIFAIAFPPRVDQGNPQLLLQGLQRV